MGKIKCISKIVALFFVINLMNSCKEPEFLLIKHKGEISESKYSNGFYKVFNNATFLYLFEIDTIRLKNIDLPSILKKNLLEVSKNGADLIFRAQTKTTTVGNLFLIHDNYKGNLNNFSAKVVKDLSYLGTKNIKVNWSENIFRIDTTSNKLPFVFVEPTNSIKNSKINTLSYELKNKKDTFRIHECQLSFKLKDKDEFLRVIYCINLSKSLNNLEFPKFIDKDFKSLIYSWVACLDTINYTNTINSQKVNNLFAYADTILRINGIKAAYDSLDLLNTFYTLNNDFQSKSYYYQVMATLSSFSSNNLSTLKFDSKAHPKYNNKILSLPKSIVKNNSIEYIVNRFGNEPIIMVNEAHDRGQNRDFARKLLPKLYEKGFKYLCVEALEVLGQKKDSLLNKRTFPILSSGYYLKESAFGQLIRDALKLGFKIVAYEDTSAFNPNISYIEGQNIREIAQAKNIVSIFKGDKSAKVLVYAGYGHIEKRTNDKWIKMAEKLCKTLNRNIPSIDCVLMQEGFERKDENEYYRAAIDSFKFKYPIVLVQNDTPFVHPYLKGKVDLNVFLPRTNYDLGYPDWLKETDDTYYTLKLPENCDDAYLQVYKANEWREVNKEAIPVMQFTIQKDRPEYKLYLRKGDYKLFISKNNKNLVDKDFKVE